MGKLYTLVAFFVMKCYQLCAEKGYYLVLNFPYILVTADPGIGCFQEVEDLGEEGEVDVEEEEEDEVEVVDAINNFELNALFLRRSS